LSQKYVLNQSCPEIPSEIIEYEKGIRHTTRTKGILGGNKKGKKYVEIQQIYDENTIKMQSAAEELLKVVASEKIFWTREILKFFKVDKETMKAFLKSHEEHINSLERIFKGKSSGSSSLYERAVSYLPKRKNQ